MYKRITNLEGGASEGVCFPSTRHDCVNEGARII